MRILLIQVVLVVGILIISARLLRGRGARVVALRRIGMLAFAALAIASILFPETWTRVAKLVGVGRGTDMVLYALVVAFLSTTVTTYLRFREMEVRYTALARRMALAEAESRQLANPFLAPDFSAAAAPRPRTNRLGSWELLTPLFRAFEYGGDSTCMPLPEPAGVSGPRGGGGARGTSAQGLELMHHQAQVVT